MENSINSKEIDYKKKKIIIATHYVVYGAPQALREFLINNKIGELIFIGHPLKIDGTKSYIEKINNGIVENKKEFTYRSNISIINYIAETIITINKILKNKEKFDVYIGVDSLNAFAGLFLRKIGKVRKVIFYTIDYVPKRFKNKFLNNLYHKLDKYCLKNADETWNVSYRIAEGREKERGLKQEIYNKQKVVPIGIWFDKVKRLPFEEIKKNQLLFLGNLLEKQGVQLVLDSMPEIIVKIPNFHFLIVGGGEYEEELKKKVNNLELENFVTFTGWIKDREKLDQIMADSALAIAMYDKEKDYFTYYADPTKLKDYLSAGLPILLTEVPHNASEIELNKCGKIISYEKKSILDAVVEFMRNEQELKEYRENALNYIKQFEWSLIFEKNFKRIYEKNN